MRRFLLALVALLLALVVLPPLLFALFPEEAPALPEPGRRIPVGNGLAVNAVERGTGPPVVLVHGLPGSGYDWAPLTEALAARGHRVIAYDRVGYGHSDGRPDDDFTVAANARELHGLLESEGLDDVTVVGWSYGGSTVMQAAQDGPGRIGRVVLVGSAGPLEHPPEEPVLMGLLFSPPVLRWAEAVPPLTRGMQRGLSIEAFSGQPMPDWWLPQLEANFAAPHTRRTWLGEEDQFRWDDHDPAAIDLPILVIHGDDDRLVSIDVGRTLHELAPRSELLVVEDGSHMLPITHAELLADRIAEFDRSR